MNTVRATQPKSLLLNVNTTVVRRLAWLLARNRFSLARTNGPGTPRPPSWNLPHGKQFNMGLGPRALPHGSSFTESPGQRKKPNSTTILTLIQYDNIDLPHGKQFNTTPTQIWAITKPGRIKRTRLTPPEKQFQHTRKTVSTQILPTQPELRHPDLTPRQTSVAAAFVAAVWPELRLPPVLQPRYVVSAVSPKFRRPARTPTSTRATKREFV
jgi:hypothetical protein